MALGGFFFGLVIGKIVVFWLQRVFNDAMVEITITLASTYLTYYIGEEVLGVSGVLAVVMLGIEINSQKTSISPEVEVFLHKYVVVIFLHFCTFVKIQVWSGQSTNLSLFRLVNRYAEKDTLRWWITL